MRGFVAFAVVLALGAASARELWREPPVVGGVVAPLADPAVVPGVGRCTSDGICVVTDDAGTRAAAGIAIAP